MRKAIDFASMLLLAGVSAAVIYSAATAHLPTEPSAPPPRAVATAR